VTESSEWVSIGVVIGAHNIKGELKVKPLIDHWEQYDVLESIWLFAPDAANGQFMIEKVRYLKHHLIIKLKGIDSRSEAEFMKRFELKIPRAICLPEIINDASQNDIIGFIVKTDDDVVIGELIDIWEMPANAVYVVDAAGKEVLLPAVKEIVKSINLEKKIIRIQLIDGLLD